MKKILILLLSGATILAGSSCKKYLNVNTNPNSATSVSAYQVIDEAIVYAAANRETYNDMGDYIGGYAGNAGGYGGFGSAWTYDYATSDYAGNWQVSYSMLENVQYVITATATDPTQTNYNAMAKIIGAYEFEELVDTYNDIPYAQALQGVTYLTPKFDSASAVYQAIANSLDSAILEINNAGSSAVYSTGADPLFGGDMTMWKQFANTIKLRLIVHASSVMTFTNTTFSSDGFLTTDAIVNPGYAQSSGKTNPAWGDWVVSYTGSAGDRAWVPSAFIFGFYNGVKLNDSWRGALIYHDFPGTPIGQLGITIGTPSAPGLCGAWYSGLDTSSSTSLGNAFGVMKDPSMGMPLFSAAESYFLQAEAYERGLVTSGLTDVQAFQAGLLASFTYLEEDKTLTLGAGYTPATDVASYLAANPTSYLVNYSLATTPAQKLEAIITQKYLANNMINSAEGWNEFRRTGYPVCGPTPLGNPYGSFASTQSQATSAYKLPTRVLYPNTEFEYNDANVPQGISAWGSKIFYDAQ
jgi:hypothetical protein